MAVVIAGVRFPTFQSIAAFAWALALTGLSAAWFISGEDERQADIEQTLETSAV